MILLIVEHTRPVVVQYSRTQSSIVRATPPFSCLGLNIQVAYQQGRARSRICMVLAQMHIIGGSSILLPP